MCAWAGLVPALQRQVSARVQVKTAFLDSPRPQRAVPPARCRKYHWHLSYGPGRIAVGPSDDYPAARAGNELVVIWARWHFFWTIDES